MADLKAILFDMGPASTILALFFICFFVIAFVLVAIFIYRGDIKGELLSEKRQWYEVWQDKKNRWLEWFSFLAFILGCLFHFGKIGSVLFVSLSLPLMLGIFYALRFKKNQESHPIRFLDIFRHPIQNSGFFIFFCGIILLCLIFLVPMLILTQF